MLKYRLSIISAVLTFIGSVLVFVSFAASSSDLVLIVTEQPVPETSPSFIPERKVMFCLDNRVLISMHGAMFGIGGGPCNTSEDARHTAVVNTDVPWLSKLGWLFLTVGFFLQVWSIERPTFSGDELRKLKALAAKPDAGAET